MIDTSKSCDSMPQKNIYGQKYEAEFWRVGRARVRHVCADAHPDLSQRATRKGRQDRCSYGTSDFGEGVQTPSVWRTTAASIALPVGPAHAPPLPFCARLRALPLPPPLLSPRQHTHAHRPPPSSLLPPRRRAPAPPPHRSPSPSQQAVLSRRPSPCARAARPRRRTASPLAAFAAAATSVPASACAAPAVDVHFAPVRPPTTLRSCLLHLAQGVVRARAQRTYLRQRRVCCIPARGGAFRAHGRDCSLVERR